MIRKIISRFHLLVISLFFVATFLIGSVAVVAADSGDNGDNGDNPLQIVIEPSDNSLNNESELGEKENISSEYPDLGDEQVFPFVAGFGKNSGKD
tara:strand:- start:144 stop:428 length:285 start_codon:yes stop_codon:yes gene_type:complete